MWIDSRSQALIFFAFVCAPALAVANEEALGRRQIVNRIELLIFGIFLPRQISEQRAAEIGKVFAVGEFTVDLDVIDNSEPGILIDHAFCTLLESFAVRFSPPVAQVSFFVELATFVVKGVRMLVPHGSASIAIVGRGV